MSKTKSSFKNYKILIYGLGKSGKSSFDYLKKNNFVKVYDDNKKNLNKKKIKKDLIDRKQINKLNFDFIVVSPGINIRKCGLKNILTINKKKLITDLDIFYLDNPEIFNIAITGTNGKSTTAKLLYDIIKKSKKDVRLVGNIGNPILAEKKIKHDTIVVTEVSSFQIDYSKFFRSDFSAILNVFPDHLERHGNFKNYLNIKFKIFKKQKKNGVCFFENGNKIIDNLIKSNKIKKKIVRVNTNLKKNFLSKIYNINFKNINNVKNLAFALTISEYLNINKKNILRAIEEFEQLNFRQQIIFNKKNIVIINDSKSTSFSSSENLLKSFKNIYWIVGGLPKKGDNFSLNKKYFSNIQSYIYGKNKNFFVNQFKKKIKFNFFQSISEILKYIKKQNKFLEKKYTIIFSPASASYDQFKNFEHRGRYFNKLIKKHYT